MGLRESLNKIKKIFKASHRDDLEKRETAKPKKIQRWTIPWYVSYSYLSDKVERLFPPFEPLRIDLLKSNMLISFRAYLSFLLFASGLAFVASIPILLATAYAAVPTIRLELIIIPTILFAMVSSIITFSLIYFYPSLKASSRKSRIDSTLPYAVSFMSILSSAGTAPDRIFRIMAEKPELTLLHDDAKMIMRDIHVLGKDLLTALSLARERSPSRNYANVLEGIISNAYSGGDLVDYLNIQAKELMNLRKIYMNQFLNTLAVLAEISTILLVAFPLIMIVILGILALLGPSTLFGLPIPFLIYLATYFVLPTSSLLFLVILNTITPK